MLLNYIELGKWNDISRYSDIWYPIDYRKPEQFCRFGSAKEYYERSMEYLIRSYPYDGSWKQKKEWFDSLMPWDRYIFNMVMPKSKGYITFSPNGWGPQEMVIGEVGVPVNKEYIHFFAGPNRYGAERSEANIYEPNSYRGSNVTFGRENTVEFFLKRGSVNSNITTMTSCVLDVWNQEHYSSPNYRRFMVQILDSWIGGLSFRVEFLIGGLGASVDLFCKNNELRDNQWHHHSLVIKFSNNIMYVDWYMDGEFYVSANSGSVPMDFVDKKLVCNIGAFLRGWNNMNWDLPIGAGKLEASLDEFRFYHYARTSEDIALFSKSQVFGGTDTDSENLGLGVYFKFNEGISGYGELDRKILDYSGRKTNAIFEGYTPQSRSLGSAFEEVFPDVEEEEDLIIYPSHPEYQSVFQLYSQLGSEYDETNNNSVYSLLPQLLREQYDSAELRSFSQVLGAFFDYMILSVYNLHVDLYDRISLEGTIPIEVSKKYLESLGVKIGDLFGQAEWNELLLGITESISLEESIEKVKRIIFSLIANNAMFLLKSKGSLSSLQSSLRCMGVAEDIVSIKKYNVSCYESTDERIEEPTYYRERCLKNINIYNNTVCNAIPKDSVDSHVYGPVMPPPPSGGENYFLDHSFVCEFVVDNRYPTIETTSIFGCKAIGIGGDDLFNVYLVADRPQSEEAALYVRSPRFGIDFFASRVYIPKFFNGGKYVAVVKFIHEESEYAYPLHPFITRFKFFVYRLNYPEVEVVASNDYLFDVLPGPILFIDNSYAFYCGAERQKSGEYLTGEVVYPCTVDIIDYRYIMSDVEENYIYDTYFGGKNVACERPFYKKVAINQMRHALNVFVWKFDYLLEDGSNINYVKSFVNNSLHYADVDSEANFKRHYPFQVVGDFVSVKDIVYDRYFSGFKEDSSEEHIMSGEKMEIINSGYGKYFKKFRYAGSFYTVEKSISNFLNKEIFSWFLNVVEYFDLFNCNGERYSYEYNVLPYAKRMFFNTVKSDIDFNEFFNFYKWIDDSIYEFILNFFPIRNRRLESVDVVEQHALERSKIPQKRILQFVHGRPNLYDYILPVRSLTAGSDDFGKKWNSILIDPMKNIYFNYYDVINTNSQYCQNKFYVRFPNYQKHNYESSLPSGIFGENLKSPLMRDVAYDNFKSLEQRKKYDTIFVNFFQESYEEMGSMRRSNVSSLELNSTLNINYRILRYRKLLNNVWGSNSY